MAYFFSKLIGPRPTFPMDITDAEREIFERHFAYWRGIMAQGKVLVYGPVMDPRGPFGIAVLEVDDEAEARHIAANDPAITANAGFGYEIHSMPSAIVRG